MMKKKLIMGLLVLCLFSLYGFSGEKEFSKGSVFITPQVALYTYAPNFGASLEIALTENIGIGGSIMFALWSEKNLGVKISESLITPSVDAYYHFTKIAVKKLDLFAGASLGFSIYSWSRDFAGDDWGDVGSSGLYLTPFVGGRYYLNKKFAVCLRLNVTAIGDWAGIGSVLGVTIKVK
jgi:hypothetical protein